LQLQKLIRPNRPRFHYESVLNVFSYNYLNVFLPIFIFTRMFFIYDMNTTSVSLATTLNFSNYK